MWSFSTDLSLFIWHPPPPPSPCGIAVVQQSRAQRNLKPSGQRFTGRWKALRCTAARALPGACRNLQTLGTLEVLVVVGVQRPAATTGRFNRLLSKYTLVADNNWQSLVLIRTNLPVTKTQLQQLFRGFSIRRGLGLDQQPPFYWATASPAIFRGALRTVLLEI